MIPHFGDNRHKTIRIFISSTFSDLQREREVLVRSVFPRLRRVFSDRSVEIIDVDLRWGLPEDLSESGRIIEVCLGEVLRCRPFFMGILGRRLGYVPNREEVGKAGPDLDTYVGCDDVTGMSITEMEIRTGLNPRFGRTVYSFHMKRGDDDSGRLSELKHRLESRGGSYYEDLDSFEEQAYSALYEHIDRECPVMDLPYGDDRYPMHLSILNERASGYIPLSSHVGLEELMSRNNYVHVLGGKGSGKTSLMAHLIEEFGVNRDATLFYHFTGTGGDSMFVSTVSERFRRFVEYHVGPVDTTSEDDASILRELVLAWPDYRELYFLLDATEKMLTSHNLDLELYRMSCDKPSIRFVCSSTIPFSEREPSATEFRLSPLGAEDRATIVESYLGRYGKGLSPVNVSKITSNGFMDNPLNLVAVCDLLRVYGDFDTFNEHVERTSSISNLSQLLDAVTENLGRVLSEIGADPRVTSDILNLVAFSYRGVRERDIGEILGISPIARVMVLQAFDSFITDVNGLLRVDHDLMADCITARGASEEDSVRRRIIEYFRHREDTDSYMELAHQYGVIGDSESLSSLLSRREVYGSISVTDRNLLIRSFNRLKSIVPKHLADLRANVDPGDLPVICPLLVEGGCFAACIGIVPEDVSALGRDRYVVLNAVARSQYKLGLDGFVRARETYRNLIDEYTSEFPDDELGTVEFILKYAIACVSSGRVDDAIFSYEHLMSLFQSRDIHNYYSSWVSGNLAGCYMRVGRVADSRPYYEYAVDVRRRLYGERSPEVAWEYCYYWTYLVKTRQFAEALDVSGKALDIYVETYGEDSVECAWSLTNHAASLVYEGLYDDARREFSRSIELNDSVLPVEMRPHPYALTTYNNRALLDVLMGGGSEEELLEIFEYKNSRNGVGHPYNANTCICLGSMTTDVEKSLHYYGMALEILDGGAFAGGPDSLFVELCMEVRKGSGEECLDGILSRYAPECLENPDIRFLIGCVKGCRDESYPKVAVSHNNTSELLLFPL